MNITEKHPLDTLVHNSLQYNSAMKELLQRLRQQLEKNSIDKVGVLIDQYNELQQKVQKNDDALAKHLDMAGLPADMKNLEYRKELQADILHLIQQIVPRANTIKSVLKNEILSLKKGRSAMGGYRSKSANQGRIIDKTS